MTRKISVTLTLEDLYLINKKLAHAMSLEESRIYLNGVYLHYKDGELRAVATDGHRLGKLVFSEAEIEGTGKDFGFILPRELIAEFGRIKARSYTDKRKKTTLTFSAKDGNHVEFTNPQTGATTSYKLTDIAFPDYEKLVTAESEYKDHFTFNPDYLMEIFKALSFGGGGKTVKILFDPDSHKFGPSCFVSGDDTEVFYLMPKRT